MRVLPSDASTILTSVTIAHFVQSACNCFLCSKFMFLLHVGVLQILFHCIYFVQLADGPVSGFCLCSSFNVHRVAF